MKHLFILLLTLLSLSSNGQTVKFTDLSGEKPKGTYTTYISKNGETYTIGDTIRIGVPSGTNGRFVYIQIMDIFGNTAYAGPEATNTTAELKKIHVLGTSRAGWKISFQTKGQTGLANYFFFIEDATASGEIKSKTMTSDEALAALKKAKDKLDLDLINQEEYNKIKAELRQYIK